MNTREYTDITGDIGPLEQFTGPRAHRPYPMYSYNRAAYMFWQGMYEGLIDSGRTHDEAMEVLQSKHMRWAFDGDLSSLLQQVGKDYALAHAHEWTL